jgi:hypothetical protein
MLIGFRPSSVLQFETGIDTKMSLSIPAGSRVRTGAPTRPLERTIVEAIARVVAQIPGIAEAHLPLCQVEGVMAFPALVLVVAVGSLSASAFLADDLQAGISKVLAPGEHLDVWPLATGDPVLQAVRSAKCQIFPRE